MGSFCLAIFTTAIFAAFLPKQNNNLILRPCLEAFMKVSKAIIYSHDTQTFRD